MTSMRELMTPRRVIGTGLLLFGGGLGLTAIAEHEHAQHPYSVVTHIKNPKNWDASVCVQAQHGQKPDCTAPYSVKITDVQQTETATHPTNERLSQIADVTGGAACVAILAGAALVLPESLFAEKD